MDDHDNGRVIVLPVSLLLLCPPASKNHFFIQEQFLGAYISKLGNLRLSHHAKDHMLDQNFIFLKFRGFLLFLLHGFDAVIWVLFLSSIEFHFLQITPAFNKEVTLLISRRHPH